MITYLFHKIILFEQPAKGMSLGDFMVERRLRQFVTREHSGYIKRVIFRKNIRSSIFGYVSLEKEGRHNVT